MDQGELTEFGELIESVESIESIESFESIESIGSVESRSDALDESVESIGSVESRSDGLRLAVGQPEGRNPGDTSLFVSPLRGSKKGGYARTPQCAFGLYGVNIHSSRRDSARANDLPSLRLRNRTAF
ncbi:MAG: hypothetical protein DWQ47_10430 [Acidobacteria bacterium]|nr:MAG: hypothetical protein DWQ32_12845 [Acidobacteriota bacterium]REJ98001.1 MAG: hypothetical protein DWQ38_15645 [Acidobacteriota bacterium]REK16744.1 MAG: hypothetical protein DWQ43_00690 [Acidobacteriota bacterium]REK42655.1 MAG: hypothetical protein DWQ47_10430 [Acidobacteriota bacterium]